MKNFHLNIPAFKNALWFVFFGICFCHNSMAQSKTFNDSTILKNNLKLNIETPWIFSLSYHRSLKKFGTIGLGITGYTISEDADINFLSHPVPSYNEIEQVEFLTRSYLIGIEYRFYIMHQNKPFNGFYIGPHLFWGKHRITVFEDFHYVKTSIGSAYITGLVAGLKLGYQKQWKKVNLELGINFTQNRIVEDVDGLHIDNGEIIEFNRSVNGDNINFYIGFGIAF